MFGEGAIQVVLLLYYYLYLTGFIYFAFYLVDLFTRLYFFTLFCFAIQKEKVLKHTFKKGTY